MMAVEGLMSTMVLPDSMTTECSTNDVYSTVLVHVAYIQGDSRSEVLRIVLFLEIIFIFFFFLYFNGIRKLVI